MTKFFQRLGRIVTKLSEYGKALLSFYNSLEPIELAKRDVMKSDENFSNCKNLLKLSNQQFSKAVQSKSKVQQEINQLLYKKPDWTANELSLFTSLCQDELKTDISLKEAKLSYNEAEKELEDAHHKYIDSLRRHYTEEQVWTEQSRRISVYFSLALFVANSGLFLVSIVFFEPRKRKQIVLGVEELITENTDKITRIMNEKLDNLSSKTFSTDKETQANSTDKNTEKELSIVSTDNFHEKKNSIEKNSSVNSVKYFSVVSTLIVIFSLIR